MTDGQIASDTHLWVTKVRSYLSELDKRQAIKRDGVWLLVCGYFGRQPKTSRLLRGVVRDISECSSIQLLQVFARKYPEYRQWVEDRLLTFTGPSPDRQETVGNTIQRESPKPKPKPTSTGPSGDGPDDRTVAHATGSKEPQETKEPETPISGRVDEAFELRTWGKTLTLLQRKGREPLPPAWTANRTDEES